MITRNLGRVVVSNELLESLLQVPEGVEIIEVRMGGGVGTTEFVLAGNKLPSVGLGERIPEIIATAVRVERKPKVELRINYGLEGGWWTNPNRNDGGDDDGGS